MPLTPAPCRRGAGLPWERTMSPAEMLLIEHEPITYPYPGLRSFGMEEAEIFFGRDEHIDDLLGRLQKRRFLGVVGPSGCGKSSLIRAGLIPALQAGLAAPSGRHRADAET